MDEQNKICPESLCEQLITSNDARIACTNQFLNSQREHEI